MAAAQLVESERRVTDDLDSADYDIGRVSLVVATAPLELSDLEPYRRELTGYCYRMLGSSFEAEDAVQETMIKALRGASGFEGRASVRSWLYRIASNVCID